MDAGLRLLGELRFQDVLDAVETRAIAEAAGVTTGSFFHHFRSREHYAQAVLDRWVELWGERVRRLATNATRAADEQGAGGVRSAAELEWEALTTASPTEVVQHLVWALRDQPVVDGSARTGAEVLGEAYARLGATVRAEYERGMRAIGREPMPPFTQAEMELVTTAVAEGLQLRALVDPAAVRDDLYGDAVAALLLGATRPRRTHLDSGADDVDLHRLERRLGGSPVVAGADGPVSERWRQVADAAAHLFVDRGPTEVSLAEVAASAGVGVSLVDQEFGSVAAVGAAGWARLVPELEAVLGASSEDDPLRQIEEVLLRLVQLARRHRGATEALLAQLAAEARPDAAPPRRPVRQVAPIPELLAPLVQALRRSGRLRRGVEIDRLSHSVVHLVTVQALLFPDESPERVVDETMTMVFDGSLVAPSRT